MPTKNFKRSYLHAKEINQRAGMDILFISLSGKKSKRTH